MVGAAPVRIEPAHTTKLYHCCGGSGGLRERRFSPYVPLQFRKNPYPSSLHKSSSCGLIGIKFAAVLGWTTKSMVSPIFVAMVSHSSANPAPLVINSANAAATYSLVMIPPSDWLNEKGREEFPGPF